MTRIRTVIADDQDLVRSGFTLILETQTDIEVVGEARDGREAVALCGRLQPDVVLMDVRMPLMDGIEATRQVTKRSGVRVLMLTTFNLDAYVYDAFRAGASGFLLKDVRRDDLIHAVRAVASGDTLIASAITRRLIEEFLSRSHPTGKPEALDKLTARELEIFTLIGRGKSNAEIARCLIISEATIKTHVSRIFSKLRLRDRVQAVVLAYETGTVRPGQES